jgi:hypothetical protein
MAHPAELEAGVALPAARPDDDEISGGRAPQEHRAGRSLDRGTAHPDSRMVRRRFPDQGVEQGGRLLLGEPRPFPGRLGRLVRGAPPGPYDVEDASACLGLAEGERYRLAARGRLAGTEQDSFMDTGQAGLVA